MRTFLLALAMAATPTFVQSAPLVCTAQALAAKVALPPLKLACNDNQAQLCSNDTPSTFIDNPSCMTSVGAYAKVLDKILTPRWWATRPQTLEACRVRGKEGPLTSDESDALDTGYGEMVQGTDRVRLILLGDVCETPGISNILLVVRGDRGTVVTPLYLAYNQGGHEVPFSLDVVNQGGNTYALFTSMGHDISDIFTATSVYKVDLVSGAAAPYALFRVDSGDTSILQTSEPIGADLDESQTGLIDKGRFVPHFIGYHANYSCMEGDPHCQPVRKTGYTWNGAQFVMDGYDVAHKNYLRKLAEQRACLARDFDKKTGVSNCSQDLACEANNDLSLLSFRAGVLDRAKDYASDAMEYCSGRAQDLAAAEFNYKRAAAKQ